MTHEELHFLAEADRALAGPYPYASVLARTLDHLELDGGTLHVLEPDGHLHLRAWRTGLPASVHAAIARIPVGKGMAGLAVERGEAVATCNLETDASGDVRPGAKSTGFGGSICVPLLAGDRAIGALGVATRLEREFSDEERTLLLELGRRIARSIEA